MRITKIHIENFKSLVDFDLDLAKFTCLIGLNGSGKSTVLQAIDFISQQVNGRLTEWLENREWSKSDLRSSFTPRDRSIRFKLEFAYDSVNDDTVHALRNTSLWDVTFNPYELRITTERIVLPATTLEVARGRYRITIDGVPGHLSEIPFAYEGSILSQLRENVLGHELIEFKSFITNIHSLDMLSPTLLRRRTRESAGSLGLGGERLSAYLHEKGRLGRSTLTDRLKNAYKPFNSLHTRSLRSGWKQLDVLEVFDNFQLTTPAKHINDGFLRLCAIVAELQADYKLVLFDEIENGINPELVEFVIGEILGARAQVVATTHSPLILNYLPDSAAKESIVYMYRMPNGYTKSIKFFDIPSMAKKLEAMGPGEVYADTFLTQLTEEINEVVAAKVSQDARTEA